MALTLGEIEASTREFFDSKEAQDVYYKGNVAIYRMLKKAKSWDGGIYIRQVLDYGQPIGGDFNAASKFDTNRYDTLTAARWTYAMYYEPVTYSIDDVVQNAGVAQEIDIVQNKLTKAQKHLRSNMADDFYGSSSSGGTGRKLLGLPAMVSQTSTYGGIAVAELAEWKAGAVTTTSEPITFNVIRTGRTSCTVGDDVNDEPNLLITTRTLLDAVKALTLPHLRLEHGDLADVGFKNIDFEGAPLVGDYKCTAGYLFWLNELYMGFRVHTAFNFKRQPWMRPTDQYIFTTQIITVLQMICKRRDAHGYHSNLTA
jgi:hypothetical protein